LRSHLRIHKSLASAGEDFFLFCDPPVTPAFAFLLTDAAAAIGGLGTDAVTAGESDVSHAARLAAGGSPSPGTGSPAHSAPAAAVSPAVAAVSLKALFRITLGSTAEFSTQYSLGAAADSSARSGRSLSAAADSTADTAATAAAGSTTADTPAGAPTPMPSSRTNSPSLTSLATVAEPIVGAAVFPAAL